MASVAAAAATAEVARKSFGYNRENFQEDREQRMKKEFAERKFRIQQAQLWRDDVRQYVSLTERKMTIYLLVNVLILSFNVNLWTEGRLPETTPEWLTMGMQISIAVSFLFLLLTVWLAMHAAVAAQSYQTRVLTQLVRLPIPSWEELEACRTYSSEFERVEPRHMFRLPFLFGRKQEDVARDSALLTAIPEHDDEAPADDAEAVAAGSQAPAVLADDPATDPWGLERRGDDIYELGCHFGADVAKLRHIKLLRQAAVYWQTYDAFARVSMSVGVNQLLLAVSYYLLGYLMTTVHSPVAAFVGMAICMAASFFISRIDLTLSTAEQRLFCIFLVFGPSVTWVAAYRWSVGYELAVAMSDLLAPLAFVSHGMVVGLMTLLVKVRPQENGAILPAAFEGVLFLDVFGWVSHKHAGKETPAAAGKDPLPPTLRASRLPGSVSTVPPVPRTPAAVSTPAGAFQRGVSPTTPAGPFQRGVSPAMSHASPASRMHAAGTSLPGVQTEQMGYFAQEYLRQRPTKQLEHGRTDLEEKALTMKWEDSQEALSDISDSDSMVQRREAGRPATGAIAYDTYGVPQPFRPDDAMPVGSVQDMRLVPGAPRMWDTVNAIDPPAKGFWNPVTFMPPEGRQRSKMDEWLGEDSAHDLFDKQAPAIGRHSSIAYFSGPRPEQDAPIETGHDNEVPGVLPWKIFQNASRITSLVWIMAGIYNILKATDILTSDMTAWLGLNPEPNFEPDTTPSATWNFSGSANRSGNGTGIPPAFLQERPAAAARGFVGRHSTGRPAAVGVEWPYRSIQPRSIACDAEGQHLVATDGIALYMADLAGSKGHSAFTLLPPCPALRGQALEDAAITCAAGTCEVLVLHGRGTRVTSFRLETARQPGRGAPAAAVRTVSLSDKWLRGGATVPEAPRWLIVNHACVASRSSASAETATALERGCVSVGTSQSRVARLRLGASGLFPVDILDLDAEANVPATTAGASVWRFLERRLGAADERLGPPVALRSIRGRTVGMLEQGSRSIRVAGARSGMAAGRKPWQQASIGLPWAGAPPRAFCTDARSVFVLGEGSSPEVWRADLPAGIPT